MEVQNETDAAHLAADGERFNWRDHLSVHPAADLFPLMSESELKELAEDIRKNGLQQPIILHGESIEDKSTHCLIDGRNRLDALAALGWLVPTNRAGAYPFNVSSDEANISLLGSNGLINNQWMQYTPFEDDEAVPSIVLSLNVHRRHLKPEQKRDLIATLLKANPEKSNRAIAAETGISEPTVRRARAASGDAPDGPRTGLDGRTYKLPAQMKMNGQAVKTDDFGPAAQEQIANALEETPEESAEKRNAEYAAATGGPVSISTLRTNVSLEQWKTLSPEDRQALLSTGRGDVKNVPSFNRQTSDGIEWAQWSWNPVTGCKHTCPYCYARDMAESARLAKSYPHGFAPAFRPAHLLAPRSASVPKDAETDTRFRNVFTCSMADLFGRWVPAEWIEAVLSEIRNAPQWNFLCLTKFPQRIPEFKIPANAWMGTTVDLQSRVDNAEEAFSKIKTGVRWLSIEPMIEPLKFKNLERFDWIVIGGASPSDKTPEWYPPFEWIVDLVAQARTAGTKVYFKTNLGIRKRILELPFDAPIPQENGPAPAVFHYLGKGQNAERAAV